MKSLRRHCRFIVAVVATCIGSLQAQVFRVELTSTISIDPPGGHISVLSSDVPPEYEVPRNMRNTALFFRLEHAVLVTPHESGQLLIFDSDNDKVFSEGDPRFFFPNDLQELIIALPNNEPRLSIPYPDQETASSPPANRPRIDSIRFSIQRKPDLPDSILALTVDEKGNLLELPTRAWSLLTGEPSFDGRAGSFYFTDWMTARKGTLLLDDQAFEVGLNLRSWATSFDDSSTRFLVDVNGDHKFNVLNHQENRPVYRPFSLAHRYFRVAKVDVLGQWVELIEVDSSLARIDDWSIERTPVARGVVVPDSSFKNLTLTSTTGEEIRLDSLNDRFVLLNFWGEWCAPCIDEIPTLIDANVKYGRQDLSIIGLLRTEDVEKALTLAKTHKMRWPQVRLTDSLARYFSVLLYPTNILVFPGGEFVVRTLTVGAEFFEQYVSRRLR